MSCHGLRQGLITLQFKIMRELIEAAQVLETCIGESYQGQYGVGKRKDIDYSMNRPPLLKGRADRLISLREKGGHYWVRTDIQVEE
jgi:hypothetical protein